MNETSRCQDKDALVTYLYGEADEAERREMEAHLAGCAACGAELEALGGVRATLASWSAPDRALGFRLVRDPVAAPLRHRWWSVPAWAQAAAAVLLVAAAAAVANLDIRYDRSGLEVRTGWQKRPAALGVADAARPATPVPAAQATAAPAPWRTEMAALAQQLRQEFAAMPVTTRPGRPVPAGAPAADEAQLLARFDALIQASEQRQRAELARRVVQVTNDLESRRQMDMARMTAGLGQIETRTGYELNQIRQPLSYLMRASEKK